MSAFSLLTAPPRLTAMASMQRESSPTPRSVLAHERGSAFGIFFELRSFWAPIFHSDLAVEKYSGELLRTL